MAINITRAGEAVDVSGDVQPLVTRSRYSLAGLPPLGMHTFDRLDLPPGAKRRMDPTEDVTMLLLIQGACQIQPTEGQPFMADVGDVVTVGAGEAYNIQNASGGFTKIFVITLA